MTTFQDIDDGPLVVAHVVLSLDCGGLEHVVLDLVREGRTLGQDVSVVCLEQAGTLATEAEMLGARVSVVGKRPGLRPGVVRSIASVFRQIRPAVAHTHQIGALFYAGPAARLAGVPAVVHTEHGKHYNTRWRTRLLGRLAGRHAARFLCVSKDIAETAVARRVVVRSKVSVVPNGIEVERFAGRAGRAESRRDLGIPPGAPVVGTVGRLSDVKRQDRLIQAFARVYRDRPDAHLLLVGDGPRRDELGALAKSLGLAGVVHFAGYQAEPQRFLSAFDVFALTSESEGMPLVILEAWAASLPVVASRVGGLPDLIDDGRTGLLFDPGDEDALPALLIGLLSSDSRAKALADEGRRLVESKYSLRRMAETYHRHYREVLAAPSKAVGRVLT